MERPLGPVSGGLVENGPPSGVPDPEPRLDQTGVEPRVGAVPASDRNPLVLLVVGDGGGLVVEEEGGGGVFYDGSEVFRSVGCVEDFDGPEPGRGGRLLSEALDGGPRLRCGDARVEDDPFERVVGPGEEVVEAGPGEEPRGQARIEDCV